jgi:hypothetical protein
MCIKLVIEKLIDIMMHGHRNIKMRLKMSCCVQTNLHDWKKANPTTDKTLPTGQTKW